MLKELVKSFLFASLFIAAHGTAILCMLGTEKQLVSLGSAIFLGLLLLVVIRKTFKYRTIKVRMIFLKMDKVIFAWEMSMCVIKTFDYKNDFCIIMAFTTLFIVDTLRNTILYNMKKVFFTNDEYKYYKDVFELEKFILKSKFGYKEFTDEFVIDYIRDNTARYDPRVLFCLWADNEETREALCKEEALAFLKQKIREKEEDAQVDLTAMAEVRNEAVLGNKLDESPLEVEEVKLDAQINESSEENKFKTLENEDINFIQEFLLKQEDQYEQDASDKYDDDFKLHEHYAIEKDEPLTIHCNSQDEVDKLKTLYQQVETVKEGNIHTVKIGYDDLNEIIKNEEKNLEGQITKDGLKRLLTEEDSKKCLKVLTRGFEKELTFVDFYDNMRQHNNERSAFVNVFDAHIKIRKNLNFIFVVVELFVCICACFTLFLWNSPAKSSVVAVVVFILPGLYYFYTPFLYLIFNKPYAIGDRVVINGDILIVKQIELCYTLFERWNNDCVIINNNAIINTMILNIRKSNLQLINFKFYISNETKQNQIDTLRRNINNYVRSEPCLNNAQLACLGLLDCNQYELSVNIRHNINHQNAFFTWKAQNKFMKEFIRQCNKIKIEFHPLKITYGCPNDECKKMTDFINSTEQKESDI